MTLHIPDHIKTLVPYPPGKPIEELERELGITGSIKMASNENSLGPSPKAVEAIRSTLAKLHRYPDGSCYYLAEALSTHLGVAANQLVFGNGSDEIIALLAAAFVQPGEEVITSQPSFLVYPKVTQAQGGVNRVVPLKNMRHDLDTIAGLINEKTRLIFFDNPNNPTGTIFTKDEFETFLKKVPESVVVVLDEAYVDFVRHNNPVNAFDYLDSKTPVVSLRTFSKAYGLAGLRVGYGVMPFEIADFLHRVRAPFNVNSLAQVAAIAALDDEDHYQKTLEMTWSGIDYLYQEFSNLGLDPKPTQTNFFLVDIKRDGKEFYQALLHKGVIVRAMNAYGYPEYIRITVGTRAENERLIAASKEVLGH